MKSINIALQEDTLNAVRAIHNSPGMALNDILHCYRDTNAIIEAIGRHMLNPRTDPSPIKRTSIYMKSDYIDDLRKYMAQTYLPTDAIIRILVQDYLSNQTVPK